MIFSLLNVRKKTAASIAGIAIAILCLWGLSMWQDISLLELLQIMLATVAMLGGVMLAAALLVAAIKALQFLLRRLTGSDSAHQQQGIEPNPAQGQSDADQ